MTVDTEYLKQADAAIAVAAAAFAAWVDTWYHLSPDMPPEREYTLLDWLEDTQEEGLA